MRQDYTPKDTDTQTHRFQKTQLVDGRTLYQIFRKVQCPASIPFQPHVHVCIDGLHECIATCNPQEAKTHWEALTGGTFS